MPNGSTLSNDIQFSFILEYIIHKLYTGSTLPVYFFFCKQYNTLLVHIYKCTSTEEKVLYKIWNMQNKEQEYETRLSVTVQDRQLSHRTRSMETSLLLMAWWRCERVPRMHMHHCKKTRVVLTD